VKIVPLAADSLGVRSMATFVEAAGLGILIDPGASLAPARHGLPPAPEEWEALDRARARIQAWALRARVVFVSHYHEDHVMLTPDLFQGRLVLAKDLRRGVEAVQARRARALWRVLRGRADLRPAEGAHHEEGSVRLEGSPTLPHGLEGGPLGTLAALVVDDQGERERFVFASDVQGPLSPVVAGWLRRQRPTVMYLSGPPSYAEAALGPGRVDQAVRHLLDVISATGCRVILDHYALRDVRWRERFRALWDTGRVVTAAAWCGVAERPLEIERRALWARVRRPAARAGQGRANIEHPTVGTRRRSGEGR
jgi:predicted metallo-beta-lactamase superfamily hydrolase